MVGKTISHFKILKKIGAGGMGEVFLAEDTELKRRVVLKFLPPNNTFRHCHKIKELLCDNAYMTETR